MAECKVAILVDGDNISARHASTIHDEAGKLGAIGVARVYAAAHQTSEWLTAHGFRFMHAGTGKNASDLLLSIDAMEFAFLGGYDNFVIASSDGDFTHLAQRLRERGAHVLGLGEGKAPEAYRRSCSRFQQLPPLRNARPARQATPVVRLTDLDRKILEVIKMHGNNANTMPVASFGQKMHALHGVTISTLPGKSWRRYLSANPSLYVIDPPGTGAMVGIAPGATARK